MTVLLHSGRQWRGASEFLSNAPPALRAICSDRQKSQVSRSEQPKLATLPAIPQRAHVGFDLVWRMTCRWMGMSSTGGSQGFGKYLDGFFSNAFRQSSLQKK